MGIDTKVKKGGLAVATSCPLMFRYNPSFLHRAEKLLEYEMHATL
jgi:hypothetical protein